MVIIDRANWGRLQLLAEAIRACPSLDLSIICGGSTVIPRFFTGQPLADDIEQAGYRVSRVYNEYEGNLLLTMAKGAGAAVSDFAAEFMRIKPDIVLLIGDRYQALAAAVAATTLNATLVHLQGGELSGTADEKYRHAISKLADYHVPATARAARRLFQMGEHPDSILTVGCPSSDLAARVKVADSEHLLVIYHPDTSRHSVDQHSHERRDMEAILAALEALAMPTRLLWPNIDAGADGISKAIRTFGARPWLITIKNLPPLKYLETLASARCAIGNSSSFVRDSAFFGTPVVLIGDRQKGREHGENVLHCAQTTTNILAVTMRQLAHGRYHRSALYGDGAVVPRITAALLQLPLTSAKEFYDLKEVA